MNDKLEKKSKYTFTKRLIRIVGQVRLGKEANLFPKLILFFGLMKIDSNFYNSDSVFKILNKLLIIRQLY